MPMSSTFAAVKKPTAPASAKEGTAQHETAESKTGTEENNVKKTPVITTTKKPTKKVVTPPKKK